ncbi:MAG: NAD(P)H-dependent oxidoreductase [Chlamydiales bacterium]|nr:NAD(P)H-dependent oxidoreductase [Chlamydiales bacterium]
MTLKPKILAFAGSLRKDSLNKKLVKIAAKGAEEAGAEVTLIDLKNYPLPIYDQDIEEAHGLPAHALELKELMLNHDGFLISSPEYNSSMSAVLKNVIDWTSRKAKQDEVYLCCFIEKPIALLSASPGQLGGLRGLVHVRAMFSNLFSHVLPVQKSVPQADQVFDADGKMKDPKMQAEVEKIGKNLVDFIVKFKKN